MLNKSQTFGKESEAIAAEYFENEGYEIIERNYRTKVGEIDIIARDNETIVFIEVKARKTGSYGDAKYSITSKKRKKMSMTALFYLKSKKITNCKARFDVLTIQNGKVEFIKNAFNLAY